MKYLELIWTIHGSCHEWPIFRQSWVDPIHHLRCICTGFSRQLQMLLPRQPWRQFLDHAWYHHDGARRRAPPGPQNQQPPVPHGARQPVRERVNSEPRVTVWTFFWSFCWSSTSPRSGNIWTRGIYLDCWFFVASWPATTWRGGSGFGCFGWAGVLWMLCHKAHLKTAGA